MVNHYRAKKKWPLILSLISAILAIGLALFLIFGNNGATKDPDTDPDPVSDLFFAPDPDKDPSETVDLSLGETKNNDEETEPSDDGHDKNSSEDSWDDETHRLNDDLDTLDLLYIGLVVYAFGELTIYWENGTQTMFYRDYAEHDYWGMFSRDGDHREVFPEISMQENAVVIGFPQTTTRLYYLYEDGTGMFGDETLSWSFQTRHGEINIFN